MTSIKRKATRERILALLSYDPASGVVTWRCNQGRAKAGMVAGNVRPDGYSYIAIDKTLHRKTHVIWMIVHGCFPILHIDHINGNTSDDRLDNLREATRSQNLGNRKINSNNTTGFKGVCKNGNAYGAYINLQGTRHWLGLFPSAEEAGRAYWQKANELFGEFARFR